MNNRDCSLDLFFSDITDPLGRPAPALVSRLEISGSILFITFPDFIRDRQSEVYGQSAHVGVRRILKKNIKITREL